MLFPTRQSWMRMPQTRQLGRMLPNSTLGADAPNSTQWRDTNYTSGLFLFSLSPTQQQQVSTTDIVLSKLLQRCVITRLANNKTCSPEDVNCKK